MLILGTALSPVTLAALTAAATAVGAALAAVIYRKPGRLTAQELSALDHDEEYRKLVSRLREN